MNVFDKTLLFEMSFALMRRFAFIEVASPSDAVFEALIDREAERRRNGADLAKELLAAPKAEGPGPAVFMDIARFLRARQIRSERTRRSSLFETFYSYLLPQFEGIDDDKVRPSTALSGTRRRPVSFANTYARRSMRSSDWSSRRHVKPRMTSSGR